VTWSACSYRQARYVYRNLMGKPLRKDLVTVYHTTQCHVPEDHNLNITMLDLWITGEDKSKC
jgi:hypothetical protein